MTFEGLKKIDGQELYDLRYRPHKGTDLDINLYFDPETYRHVETVYTLTSSEILQIMRLRPQWATVRPLLVTLPAALPLGARRPEEPRNWLRHARWHESLSPVGKIQRL